MELKKLGVLSVAKIEAVIMAIFGFIFGIIFAITGTAFGGPAFGILSIVVFPIMYAVLGFVSGAIGAWLYNFAADKIGGIDMEFKK